jgi:hypothetical protein
MTPPGPPDAHGDRPRMAEALASLKEGLRDTADPLYDSWKLRSRTAAANAEAAKGEASVPPQRLTPRPVTEVQIDITLESTPDHTPAVTPLPPCGEPNAPTDAFLTEEAFFNRGSIELSDSLTEESLVDVHIEVDVPVEEGRASVQADTVRVPVIRYRPFPRWALVVAAALLVFAASLLALRVTLPLDSTRSTRSVLTSEVASSILVGATSPLKALPTATALPPATALPSPTAASAPPSIEPTATPIDPWDVPSSAAPGKIPSAPLHRRPGARDFFRDPGF